MIRLMHTKRTGSIYLITLITVAAIVAMVLIGMELRQSSSESSALIQQMSESSTGLMTAAEYSLQKIADDHQWNTTAQSGVVFSKTSVGDSQISASVLDADTNTLPIDTTTNYQITVKNTLETVDVSAKFDVTVSKYDYVGLLQSFDAKHYWAMNEPIESRNAIDSIGGQTGNYSLITTSGTGTNDEGGLVPIFVDSSDSLSIPWDDDFQSSEGTLTAWIKSTNSNSLESMSILGMLYKSGGYASLNLSIWNKKLYGYLSEDGAWDLGKIVGSSSNAIEPNVWYHVALSWGSKGLIIYIDGIEAGTNASNTDELTTAKKNQGGEQPLLIGAGYTVASFKHVEQGFKGSIAHTVFFPSQLSPEQIATIAAIRPDQLNMALVDGSWEQIFK